MSPVDAKSVRQGLLSECGCNQGLSPVHKIYLISGLIGRIPVKGAVAGLFEHLHGLLHTLPLGLSLI